MSEIDLNDEPRERLLFGSSWEPKPSPEELSWNYLLKALETKYISIEKRLCNYSQFYYIITAKQLEEVIDILFQEQAKSANDFYKLQSERMVYDGMIFGITKSLLEKAEKSNLSEDKLDYIARFQYLCDGSFIKIYDWTPEMKQRLSTYITFK